MSSAKKMLLSAAGVGGAGLDVSEVFSTHLYVGGVSTPLTIVNGIDLDGEGGLVWIKNRTSGVWHQLADTERGANKMLSTNVGNSEFSRSEHVKSFTSTGFTVGNDNDVNYDVAGGSQDDKHVSWTFRKAKKFFDVVTYTGNGSNRTIAHNLGSVPGMILVKKLNAAKNWAVYHRGVNGGSSPENYWGILNLTQEFQDNATAWQDTAPTSSVFSVGTLNHVNNNNDTYVAYLFAHNDDDGGFGPDGDQDIISCGAYTGDGGDGDTAINLGWEPQFVMIKADAAADNWYMLDTMRGIDTNNNVANDATLYANEHAAESDNGIIDLTSTGFNTTLFGNANVNNRTYIYMAIRAPMIKEPEAATNVFKTVVYTGDNASSRLLDMSNEVGQASDMILARRRATDQDEVSRTWGYYTGARLLGKPLLVTGYNEGVDSTNSIIKGWDSSKGINLSNGGASGYQTAFKGGLNIHTGNNNHTANVWTRAKGFFDVVIYKGTGSAQNVTHQLGVVPEMMWVKRMAAGGVDWAVYYGDNTDYIPLNGGTTQTADSAAWWNDTSPTASVFTVNTQDTVNTNNVAYICYLFASLDGISKIGTYTGNNSTKTIDCGFSNGARFVLIKGVNQGAGWSVFDTARGIVAGNDPVHLLALTTSELTNQDHIDPQNSGFALTSNKSDTNINVNGKTYLFYAIA